MGFKKVVVGLYRKSGSLLLNYITKSPSIRTPKNAKAKGTDELLITGVDEDSGETTFGLSDGKKDLRSITLIGLFLIILTAALTILRPFSGADSPQCRSIYMYPSYAKIEGFDSKFTGLAQKYHLYLYREQGKDRIPAENEDIQLDGIPILFIPGNAGSFKQVRSIAAASSNLFFDDPGSIQNSHARNLDFFAADFNEDYTAFHGRTMIDQAEYLNDAIRYILLLYDRSKSYTDPIPSSVIVIGHSMGGIVARLLPTLQNHVDHSVNTYITLSSPHALAPVTFDGDILKIYQQANDYWRNQMSDKESFFTKNVSLVSITGGILDMMLPADYTAVEDFLPIKNGFNTYSTTIPGVWTPIDHLAVVWCDQLRTKVAKLLLEIVDRTRADKVRPLAQRMAISRELLLSGLEEEKIEDLAIADPEGHFTKYSIDQFDGAFDVKESSLLAVSKLNSAQYPKYLKFSTPSSQNFSLLTSLPDLPVFFCRLNWQIDRDALPSTSGTSCVSATSDLATIPASLRDLKYAASSTTTEGPSPFKMLSVDEGILQHYDFIIIENDKSSMKNDHDFIYAGVHAAQLTNVSEGPLDLALFGSQLIPDSRVIHHTFRFPQLWDSLFSYRVSCTSLAKEGEEPPFEPFIRQWIKDPFETKWHLDVIDSDLDISFHNVAPFIPLEELHDKALMLTVILPPGSSLTLQIKVNWGLSARMLFIRYRLTFLSLPIAIACIAVAYQFFIYRQTRNFITFNSALAGILRRKRLLAIAVVVLSPMTNVKAVQQVLFLLDPIRLNRPFILDEQHIHTNPYFLGIRGWFASFLGLFFMVMAVALLSLIATLFDVMEGLVSSVAAKLVIPSAQNDEPMKESSPINDTRRLLTSLTLLCLVYFYVPYHMASALCLVVQIGTCFRIAIRTAGSSKDYSNLRNYNFSVLLILSFVVAINAPIIVVFLHNVAIKWETPFRSHHNVLAIAPIVFLISANSTFNMPLHERKVTTALFAYTGLFCLIYGARNLYWIHHLFNITCAWLLFSMKFQ